MLDVFLLNDLAALEKAQQAGIVLSDITFISDSWQTTRHLTKAGLECWTVEDFLTPEDLGDIDRFVENIAVRWYCWNDRDLSLYRAVCLGSLAEFDLTNLHLVDLAKTALLLSNIAKMLKPSVVFYQTSMLRVHDISQSLVHGLEAEFRCVGPEESIVGNPASPFPEQGKSPPKALMKSALSKLAHAFSNLAQRPYRKKVLALLTPSQEFIWSASTLDKSYVLVALNNSLPSSPSLALRLALQGRILPSHGLDPQPSYLAQAQMHRQWEWLKNQRVYLDQFVLHGVNLFGALEHILDDIVQDQFSEWSSQVDYYIGQFGKHDLAALVVPADTPPLDRLLVQVANNLGLPTLIVEHGSKEYQSDCRDFYTARYAAVWSESVKRQYAMARMEEGDVFVTGSPLYDQYLQYLSGKMASHRWSSPSKVKVLILPQSFYRLSAFSDRIHDELFLDKVLSALQPYVADCEVIIKPHPAIRRGYYESMLPSNCHGGVRVQYGPLRDFLMDSDLVVCANSTGALEALVLSKPVICLNVTQREFSPPLDGTTGIPVVEDVVSLRAYVKQFLKGLFQAVSPADFEYFLGPLDGEAVTRILEIIEDLVNRSMSTPAKVVSVE